MSEIQNIKIKEYIGRINLSIEYINNNLDKELNLAIVSRVALYSPFYFHRLFSAITNETLNVFINRKRIEKSASILMKDKTISISKTASKFGFSSNASFTKAFKKYYGINPTAMSISFSVNTTNSFRLNTSEIIFQWL